MGIATAGFAEIEAKAETNGDTQLCCTGGNRNRGLEARGHSLRGPPRLDARAGRKAWAVRASAGATIPVAAVCRGAKQPEPVVVVVRKDVDEPEGDGRSDIVHDDPRLEVSDAGVGVIREAREPIPCVITVGARDILQHVRSVRPPENGVLVRVDLETAVSDAGELG